MRDQVESEARGGPFFNGVDCVEVQREIVPASQKKGPAEDGQAGLPNLGPARTDWGRN
jgi:hypothetical protein